MMLLARTTCGAGGVVLEETSLGDTAQYDQVKADVFSADARRLAFLGVKGDKQFVVRDGVASQPYDWVLPDSLTGPRDLARLAFIVQNGNDLSMVLDGATVGSGYYFIGRDGPNFSEDGKHYAYTARRTEGGAFVVRDGIEGKKYVAASIIPAFSPDGNHVGYDASLGPGKMCIVLDDVEQKFFQAVYPGTLLFSPDSRRTAYTAIENGKYIAVVDGKESKPYDAMRLTPVFSPDSKRVAYIAGIDKEFVAVIDGQEGPKFDAFTDLLFSPDSSHVAYGARKANQWSVVLDGKPQESVEGLGAGSIRFSPDSAHLAYVAAVGSERMVVLDGKRLKSCQEVLWPGPLFSPDSRRLAYLSVQSRRVVVVTDGVNGAPYDQVADLSFSPDSKHLAYRALSSGQAVVIVDGKASSPYAATTPIVFGPEGNHYVFAASKSKGTVIVVDGVELDKSYTSWVTGSRPAFAANDIADFLMLRSKEFLHVRVKIGPEPQKSHARTP